MKNSIITSKDNKNYKFFKSLLLKKNRNKENMFFVEGIVVIEEAIKKYKAKYIVIREDFNLLDYPQIYSLREDVEFLVFEKKLFNLLCDTSSPQGILAYFEFIHLNSIEEIENGRYVFFDDLTDPGNAGGLIRSADAFNLDGVIFSKNSVDLYNPKLLRSTMASIFRIKTYIIENKNELLGLRKNGFDIISTRLENAEKSYNFKFNKNLVLVLGNEAKGISEEVFSMSNKSIYIPINGVNSLNVNVAGSILFYEMNR